MKLSDFVIDFLAERNVGHVFEICGGAITHLLDSLYERQDIRAVSVHHEQAAAFAAEGYSRVNGNLGVAMATSGPGATNLITGIGSCFFDSIPCLFITGQVNTYEFNFNRDIRQRGFQETDIVNIVKPVVKEAVLITDPANIRYELERLVYIAQSGRPGPVLLDIPMDIQRAEIEPENLKSFDDEQPMSRPAGIKPAVLKSVLDLLRDSCRPLIVAGGGVRLAKAEKELRLFAEQTGIPVACTLLGKDSFPNDHALFVGLIGTYGLRYSNLTVAKADVIFVLGARLDTRQTGTRPETFARRARIVHVDIDKSELNSKVKAEIGVPCDIKSFLSQLSQKTAELDLRGFPSYLKFITDMRSRYPISCHCPKGSVDPHHFLRALSKVLPENGIVCVDVGQHQMWAAQSLVIRQGQRFLTQGGMGAMGSAVALAMGAAFAKKACVPVVITGDGGFQLNVQELQTIFSHRLPVKIVMLNNSCYGMVRQFQEQYFNSRFQSTVVGYDAPDFQKVVPAFGIRTDSMTTQDQQNLKLEKLFEDDAPAFLEVRISPEAKVLPKLSVNRPLEDQDPLLSREELSNIMSIDILKDNEI